MVASKMCYIATGQMIKPKPMSQVLNLGALLFRDFSGTSSSRAVLLLSTGYGGQNIWGNALRIGFFHPGCFGNKRIDLGEEHLHEKECWKCMIE